MDQASRQKLTLKFAKLTIVLDGVFLFAAIAILALAGVIPVYRLPIAAVFGLASIALAVYFVGAYRRDKAWLDSVPDDNPKAAAGEKGTDTLQQPPADAAEPEE